jgi:hypothetical protein
MFCFSGISPEQVRASEGSLRCPACSQLGLSLSQRCNRISGCGSIQAPVVPDLIFHS